MRLTERRRRWPATAAARPVTPSGGSPWEDADMPSDRTTVTELGTALGMLGGATVDEALASRSAVMHSLSPERWSHLQQLRDGGAFDAEFHAAWENGRAFLAAAGRPTRAAAAGGRMEGDHAGARRRGGARRPAGGPRVPDQLQVPVGHPLQRVAVARVRRPARRRWRTGRSEGRGRPRREPPLGGDGPRRG